MSIPSAGARARLGSSERSIRRHCPILAMMTAIIGCGGAPPSRTAAEDDRYVWRPAGELASTDVRPLESSLGEVRALGVEIRGAESCTWCPIPCEAVTWTCLGGPTHVLRVDERHVATLEAAGWTAAELAVAATCEERHAELVCPRAP
jgi:hypothetical protein